MTLLGRLFGIPSTRRLEELAEQQIPTGTRSYTFTATTTIDWIQFEAKMMAFTITNLGPGSLRVKLDNPTGITAESGIPPNETYNVDFGNPIVDKIYIQSDSTCSATLFATVGVTPHRHFR